MRKKILVCLYLLVASVSIFFLFKELKMCNEKANSNKIAYHKETSTNYVTYLKDNKFYNGQYLEEDYNFVANLIDYFKIDYNYKYTLSEKVNYVLTYDINALLEVYDTDNNSKPIHKKEYNIVPKTTISNNSEVINLDLLNEKIDYQTYNKIVQEWKKEVSPNATLNIIFNVSWVGSTNKFKKQLSDSYTNVIKIPISERTINIEKPKNLLEDNILIEKIKVPFSFKITIVLTVLLIVVCLVRIVMLLISNSESKDKYDQKINKILREFDRAITEAKGKFEKNPKDNNIEVIDFFELMDVHDNLNVPIVYYKDSKNKSTFVVRNEKDVYYCVIERNKL